MNVLARKSATTIDADRKISGYASRSRYRLPILAVAGLVLLIGLLLVACEVAESPGDNPGDSLSDNPGELTPSNTKVHILFMEATGMIREVETIGSSDVDSSISAGSEFGAALAALGEINGEVHLAIGAPEQGNNGAVYIVTLESDGSVNGLVKTIDGADRASPRGESDAIALDSRCGESSAVVRGGSISKDGFSSSIASLGDLNSDGLLDLAIGAPGWNGLTVRVIRPASGPMMVNCFIEPDYGVIWIFR